MSRRNVESPVVVAVNPNVVPSTSESVAAARKVLGKQGGKKQEGKGAPGDALYNEAGSIGSGLVAVGTPEAFKRHSMLVELENACRSADDRFASYDVKAAIGEAQTMGSLLESVCDGAVATVGILDPRRVASFPKKTGIEWKDPLAFAVQTAYLLSQGSPLERALGENVRQVAERFVAANGHARQLRTVNGQAQDAVTTTRLSLRSYLLDCKKFILGVTTRDHPARKHIKKKRAPKGAGKSAEGGSTSTQGQPTSEQPPATTTPEPGQVQVQVVA